MWFTPPYKKSWRGLWRPVGGVKFSSLVCVRLFGTIWSIFLLANTTTPTRDGQKARMSCTHTIKHDKHPGIFYAGGRAYAIKAHPIPPFAQMPPELEKVTHASKPGHFCPIGTRGGHPFFCATFSAVLGSFFACDFLRFWSFLVALCGSFQAMYRASSGFPALLWCVPQCCRYSAMQRIRRYSMPWS